MMEFLAVGDGAKNTDLMSILGWVTAFVGMVLTTIVVPQLKKKWESNALRNAHVTVSSPVPTIHTKEEVELVTKAELDSHLVRIERTFEEIKEALEGERGIARTANGNIHKRIDAMSERLGDRLSKLEGTSVSINETVSKLLDLALNRKPSSRS